MASFVFFEQSNRNQSDDLMIQNESILENENSLFDCRIFEQSIISEKDPLDLFNLEDEEDISFELEKIPNDKKDASFNVFTNEKSNDSIKNSEKMIKKKRGKPASNENQKIHTKEKNDNILRKIQPIPGGGIYGRQPNVSRNCLIVRLTMYRHLMTN